MFKRLFSVNSMDSQEGVELHEQQEEAKRKARDEEFQRKRQALQHAPPPQSPQQALETQSTSTSSAAVASPPQQQEDGTSALQQSSGIGLREPTADTVYGGDGNANASLEVTMIHMFAFPSHTHGTGCPTSAYLLLCPNQRGTDACVCFLTTAVAGCVSYVSHLSSTREQNKGRIAADR